MKTFHPSLVDRLTQAIQALRDPRCMWTADFVAIAQDCEAARDELLRRDTLHPLTKRQCAIFEYIEQCVIVNGYAPNFEEIAKEFDYASLATVHEHLSNIERKGYITRRWNESRGITINPLVYATSAEAGTKTEETS